jgi:hypothetical protein
MKEWKPFAWYATKGPSNLETQFTESDHPRARQESSTKSDALQPLLKLLPATLTQGTRNLAPEKARGYPCSKGWAEGYPLYRYRYLGEIGIWVRSGYSQIGCQIHFDLNRRSKLEFVIINYSSSLLRLKSEWIWHAPAVWLFLLFTVSDEKLKQLILAAN